MKSLLSRSYKAYKLWKKRNWAVKVEFPNFSALELSDLSAGELQDLKNIWGGLGLKIRPIFYRVFKTIDSFNPKYLADDLFYPYIIRSLNPLYYSLSFQHKALYANLFPALRQPKTLLNRINGVFYDDAMSPLDCDYRDNIDNSLLCIIKPTTNSCMGRNVKKSHGVIGRLIQCMDQTLLSRNVWNNQKKQLVLIRHH